jgi:predicted Mrr-cat superfamily restriction endonuclease
VTVWMIRAGERSRHAREFSDGGIVAIGWPNIPGLQDLRGMTRDAITDALSASREITTPSADANELLAFRDDISVGDLVVVPDATTGELIFGRIAGCYEFASPSSAGDYHHVRRTDWLGRRDRELLPASLTSELRYRRTIRALTNQREWSGLCGRIEAGEGRPAGATGNPARPGRRSMRRVSPPTRRCALCTFRLPISQFDGDDAVCRSCQ